VPSVRESALFFSRALTIAAFSLATAWAVNYLRPAPLAWDWQPPPPAAETINDFEVLQAALTRPETVLVDARAAFFYQMGHLPGAVSLPVEETETAELETWRAALPSGVEIIIYCSDFLCPMADQLARKMMPLGLKPIVFSPGYDAWEEMGLPVAVSGPANE